MNMKRFKNKKILSLGLIIFFLFIFNLPTFFVLAAASNYELLAPSVIIDKNGQQPGEGGYGLKEYLRTIYLFGLVAVITVTIFWLIIGGLEYIASDLPGKKSGAKDKIWNAAKGLLIALTSYLLLNLINPDLVALKFSSSLTKLFK